VYARFIRQTEDYVNTDQGYSRAGYPVNNPSIGYQAGLDWTHTFSPTVVIEGRLNYGRLGGEAGGNTIGNTVLDESKLADGLVTATAPRVTPASVSETVFPVRVRKWKGTLGDERRYTRCRWTAKMEIRASGHRWLRPSRMDVSPVFDAIAEYGRSNKTGVSGSYDL
jgi:hypothetical protein